MNKTLLVAFSLIVAFILQSCSPPAFNPYSSFENAQYSTYINISHLEVVTVTDSNLNRQARNANYSVINATDRGSINYILISPQIPEGNMPRSASIDRHRWMKSAVLNQEKAEGFLSFIQDNLTEWDKSMDDGEAVYAEFSHRAEAGILRLPSGSDINPYFRYHFATTEQGSRFLLTFSNGDSFQTRTYRNKDDLRYLVALLEKALERI